MEIQIRRESPRREAETPPFASGCEGDGGDASNSREEMAILSKVVIRRLPPNLTKEQLEEQLHPLPAHDYFELCTADLSLHPHLYSRAYINFRNPDDILLFRDRFDGYIFIDSKGLEYPAVVEFAPFQRITKQLKKKDVKAGSIEDDPEYKKFLETYCVEEEKTSANLETLLGEIEAKTRELIARRTTPLLEYIKNRKLEKQRIREEKREERRRRELEKKRLREEEKRKREEERCKRKEEDKQKKIVEKEIRIKLLKKPEKGEETTTENQKKGEKIDTGDGKWEIFPCCTGIKPKPLRISLKELKENNILIINDQMAHEHPKVIPVQTVRNTGFCCPLPSEFPPCSSGPEYTGGHPLSTVASSRQDRPAVQIYQPRARVRVCVGSSSQTWETGGKASEGSWERRKSEAETLPGAGSEKSEEAK